MELKVSLSPAYRVDHLIKLFSYFIDTVGLYCLFFLSLKVTRVCLDARNLLPLCLIQRTPTALAVLTALSSLVDPICPKRAEGQPEPSVTGWPYKAS